MLILYNYVQWNDNDTGTYVMKAIQLASAL